MGCLFWGVVFVLSGVLCFCPKFVFALCVCCFVGCLSGCNVLSVWDVVCICVVIVFGCIVCLAVCLFCFGCNVLLLVHWWGLNVIGLVVVVGWERAVVWNGVLDLFYYG